MNKYRSLVFRELKLSRRHYLGVFALTVIFAALMILSMLVAGGEAVKNGESMNVFALLMSYAFALLTAGCVAGDNGVFKSDISSGWRKYSCALPVTALEKAIAKYAVKLIAMIIGFAVTILGSMAISAAGGSGLSPAVIFCFFVCIDVFLVFDIVYQAIVLRADDMKSLKRLGTIAGGVVLVVFTVLEFMPMDSSTETNIEAVMTEMENAESPAILNKYIEFVTIPDMWGIIGVVLMFVILAVGFVVTWKSYERREA